jgi:hypothetical protein
MPKSVLIPGVIRAATAVGAIPLEAEVTGKGLARWNRDGLSILTWLTKSRDQELEWFVNTGDSKLDDLLPKSGGLTVRVRSRRVLPIPWPTSVTPELEEFLRSGIGSASTTVVDREDLCRLLMEPDEVERGSFYIWQDRMSYPSRLVKGLVLARDLNDSMLEREALSKLGGIKGIPVPEGFSGDMFSLAKEWAKRYSREMKMEIVF